MPDTAPTPATQSFDALRENFIEGARLTAGFLLMNGLAATIASYGLLANSPAVVIGAMIIALLLGPISGVALALVDGQWRLLVSSLSTLVAGVCCVMAIGFIIGVIHRDIPVTHEILARTSPNIMDLMIALAGGAAGAYATVSPSLNTAFIGVAIATALVPPLCAASILLARGEIDLAFGAFSLSLINMVAIQFAFVVVLWFTGFRRVADTAGLSLSTFFRRNAASIVALAVLAVVLSGSLHRTIQRQVYESATTLMLQQLAGRTDNDRLVETRFQRTEGSTIVRAVVRGTGMPTADQIAAIEAKLPRPPDGSDVELRVRFVETVTMNRDGIMVSDQEDMAPDE
jgi:uncharacterized hydrophobic protein (TIGR00271 family)